MKTRYSITIMLIFLCIGTLFSQTSLKRSLQGMRSGDSYYKQQIEYKNPGRRGQNVVWNFSKLKTIDEKYGVSYVEPNRKSKDTSFVRCVEHNTMYKYGFKGDSLLMLGFENSGSKLTYSDPELSLVFPFTLGDSIVDRYKGTGRYMNTILSQADGYLTTIADAEGTLILPDGDTLLNVLRIRSERCYIQRTLPIVYEDEVNLRAKDTILVNDGEEDITMDAFAKDQTDEERILGKSLKGMLDMEDSGQSNSKKKGSIFENTYGKSRRISRGQMLREKTDSIYYRTETCRWYAPGYRYPLFETICNKSHVAKTDTSETKDVATAFYFPPSMHVYLENDPENKAILDSLITLKESNLTEDKFVSDVLLFDYNIYPNPVKSDLNIELLLDQSSEVSFRIVDASGKIVMTSLEGKYPAGIHNFTLKTNKLRFGNYVLHIIVGKQVANAMLLKI